MAGAPEGNKNATKDKRLVTNALNKAVTQNPDKLREACLAVLAKAVDGDLAAFSVIADRLDGKPHQSSSLEGPDGGPVQLQEIARTIIDPKTPNTDS